MSRQLEQKQEQRETVKRDALIRALEFGLTGALQNQGIELLGFAMKIQPFNCLLTLKADVQGKRSVCFVGSDTVINCFLKADSMASNHSLQWRADQYHSSEA